MSKKIIILLPLLLAACAMGDVNNATPLPPITLMPPSEITFQGDCNVTPVLEAWLQLSTRMAGEYLELFNEVVAKTKADMYDAVFTLAALRDTVYKMVTPDCAVDAQIILSDAMNTGVTALQAYVNGDRTDLGSAVTEVTDRIEQAIVIQNELILRMETQIRQALGTVAPG